MKWGIFCVSFFIFLPSSSQANGFPGILSRYYKIIATHDLPAFQLPKNNPDPVGPERREENVPGAKFADSKALSTSAKEMYCKQSNLVECNANLEGNFPQFGEFPSWLSPGSAATGRDGGITLQ